MKISEVTGEKTLDVMADLMEIFEDEAVKKAFHERKNSKALGLILREHKAAVVDLLSVTQETDKPKITLKTISDDLAQIFNDLEMYAVFFSQGSDETETLSTSASEITEGD